MNLKFSIISRIYRKFEIQRYSDFPKILGDLPDFPSSSATYRQYKFLTLRGAKKNYQTIFDISKQKSEPIISLANIKLSPKQITIAKKLESAFNKYGSDKASTHNYHLLYALFLTANQEKKYDILEIGIGSNNTTVPSNMGQFGIPGASLRSWVDLGKEYFVVGADIDRDILFKENRITSFYLDQTQENSWKIFLKNINKKKFDLIIDDGLHAPLSNLLTIKYLASYLKPNGVLIIEDISQRSLPIWQLLIAVSRTRFNFKLIKTKAAFILVIKNKKT
jgi:SAM-dependent methyltransferase